MRCAFGRTNVVDIIRQRQMESQSISATATTDLKMKMEFANCFKCWLSKADFVLPSGFQKDKVSLVRRRCGVLQLC